MSASPAIGQGVVHITLDAEGAGQRIDNFLIRMLKGVPKSRVYRILRKGEVRVNKGRVKAEYRLCEGDVVRIPPIRVAEREAPVSPGQRVLDLLANSIIYEDAGLLVLNKPSGIAVHGGSGVSYGVIEAMRQLRPEESGLELIHRLDRETSGCLMLARRRSTLRYFHELTRSNGIQKRYLGLTAGRWERDRERVDAPLQKNTLRSGERVVRVDPEGKEALTLFRVMERLGSATLVEADLKSGRTHQIRVHLAHLERPIVGDEKYGNEQALSLARETGLRRLGLHAASLQFPLPDQPHPVRVSAPLDERFTRALAYLRGR